MIAGALGRFRYSLGVPRRPHSLAGLLRMWWHDFVVHPLFTGTEICEDCGRGYVLWRADDELWREAMGCARGLLCPTCFERRLDKKGVIVIFTASVFRRVSGEV